MATPADKLAASLAVLKGLRGAGRVALRASDMSGTHRERLIKAGFIKEVSRMRVRYFWNLRAKPRLTSAATSLGR